MSTFRHPAFSHITTTVPDERDDEARAAGWLPLTPPPAVEKQDQQHQPDGPGRAPKGNKHVQHRRQRPPG